MSVVHGSILQHRDSSEFGFPQFKLVIIKEIPLLIKKGKPIQVINGLIVYTLASFMIHDPPLKRIPFQSESGAVAWPASRGRPFPPRRSNPELLSFWGWRASDTTRCSWRRFLSSANKNTYVCVLAPIILWSQQLNILLGNQTNSLLCTIFAF